MKSLSFGAVLWDLIEEEEHLGGAPFNLAVHLRRLGFDSYLVSAIGADDRGDRIRGEIDRHGVDGRWVRTDPEHPTAIVTVTADEQGESSYVIHEGMSLDFIELTEAEAGAVAALDFDVVCYGTLEARAPTTRRSLRLLLAAAAGAARTRSFCDLNLRQHYYSAELVREALSYCDILKLNDDEVRVTADLLFPGHGHADDREIAAVLCETFGLEVVVITRGADGCSVVTGQTAIEQPGLEVAVVDTVGPGDAFSAAFLRDYLGGAGLEEAAVHANLLGGYVASRRGALPDYDGQIARALGL